MTPGLSTAYVKSYCNICVSIPWNTLVLQCSSNFLGENTQSCSNQAALRRVEAAVHPLVAEKRQIWLEGLAARGEQLAVLDVPLLYETGMEAEVRSFASVDPAQLRA